MSFVRIKVKCPHCGFMNTEVVEIPNGFDRERGFWQDPKEICCDCEEGGCDNPFLFKANFSVEAEIEVSIPQFTNQNNLEVEWKDPVTTMGDLESENEDGFRNP